MRHPNRGEDLVGMVCVCSVGRVAIVTAPGAITVQQPGDPPAQIQGWHGIGIDGFGTWFSSSPIILSPSAEAFRLKLDERFGGKFRR